jgi:hypothetical protein
VRCDLASVCDAKSSRTGDRGDRGAPGRRRRPDAARRARAQPLGDRPAHPRRTAASPASWGLRGRASRGRSRRPTLGGGARLRRSCGAEPPQRRRRMGHPRVGVRDDPRDGRAGGPHATTRHPDVPERPAGPRRDHDSRWHADHDAGAHAARPRSHWAARPPARSCARPSTPARPAGLRRAARTSRALPATPRLTLPQSAVGLVCARRYPQRVGGDGDRALRRTRSAATARQLRHRGKGA